MPKRTRALSGAAQDAYFRRVLRTYESLPADQREELVRRLRHEIAQLRLRVGAREQDAQGASTPVQDEPETLATVPAPSVAPPLQEPAPAQFIGEPTPIAGPALFDPYSPNVIVVLRKGGREAVLSALGEIDSIDNLRLLAREQRLSVSGELASAAELRAAIVSAAERRVANRRAAAS